MSEPERVFPLRNAQRVHDALVSRVQAGTADDAKKALLYLLEYIGDPGRFVAGANLYDSYIRDLVEDAYEQAGP